MLDAAYPESLNLQSLEYKDPRKYEHTGDWYADVYSPHL